MNMIPHSLVPTARRDRLIVVVGAIAGAAILLAITRGAASGRVVETDWRSAWLLVHLSSVLPALPLGGYLLWRRKGDPLHRMLGRCWGGLMMVAAVSSFGLHAQGRLSLIHLLSALVLVSIPRAILQARRHDIAGHRRTMSLTYLGLAIAGLFTLLPDRLLGSWLFG